MTNLRDDLQSALGTAYAIEEELGGGGMSRVFVAREIALSRRVVVKVLPPELVVGVNVERFRREIQVAAQLRHPHIVPVLTAGESDGLLYYTMPFVEGESLRGRLSRQGELPVDEAVRILREIAEALAHAHRRGVVHRDIKPENVLLEEGNAQVADFGIAKALTLAAVSGSLTSVGVAVGTPAYMAPEQAAADPQTDHRADIYSFGAVAYELLTGQAPFGMRSPQALLAAHITEAPDPVTKLRQSVPPGLAAMVMRCLEKRPSDRPQSADEVIRALDLVRVGTSVQSAANTPLPPARRSALSRLFARGRVPIMAAATVAIAFVVYSIVSPRSANHATTDARGGAASVASLSDSGTHTSAASQRSIAVLPLTNMSPDPDNAYFSDGLTDELINALSGIAGLRVAARTSAFALKGKDLDVRTIADTLNVATVLTGSVRKAGQRVRVTVQLVNADDGYQLWSKSYDREIRDMFAVQEEISRAIVSALEVQLVTGESARLVRAPTEDLTAWELYLKGRYFWNLHTLDGLNTAKRYFEQALARDSGYARAYSGLAEVYTLLSIFSHQPPREVLPLAKAATRKALELDSALSQARVSKAYELGMFDFNSSASVRELERVIAQDPNHASAYFIYGLLMQNRLRFDQAIPRLKQALALDPLSASFAANLGRVYLNSGQIDQGIRHLQAALELNPRLAQAHHQLGYAYLAKGMHNEAILAFQNAAQTGVISDSAHLAYGYAVTGRRSEATSILQALLEARKHRYVSALGIATAYAGLGENDRAMQWLETAYEERSGLLDGIRTLPAFKTLHSDPRFIRLVRRMGLEE